MKNMWYDWFGLNYWLFERINGLGGAWYDKFMLAASRLGNHHHMAYYLCIIVGVLLGRLLWMRVMNQHIRRSQLISEASMSVVLIMGYALYGFIIGILKILVSLPCPYAYYYYRKEMFHYAGFYPEVAEYYTSFPSVNAATIAFLAVALWPKLSHPIAQYTAVALVFIVCYAQIAIGMHFPADVVWGAAIGLGVAYAVRYYVYNTLGISWRLTPRKVAG